MGVSAFLQSAPIPPPRHHRRAPPSINHSLHQRTNPIHLTYIQGRRALELPSTRFQLPHQRKQLLLNLLQRNPNLIVFISHLYLRPGMTVTFPNESRITLDPSEQVNPPKLSATHRTLGGTTGFAGECAPA